MAKLSTAVEFYQGTKGPLFRLIRTPEQVFAYLLFIPPLFEQANQTRHHITRSAINAYQQGITTIVFDHYGTGDSSGELMDANLLLWQQDIIKQIAELKAHSSQPIYLSLALSAVLLLSDEMLTQVDGLILLQPDFNGKRFVQQFKRLALAAQLSGNAQAKNSQTRNSSPKHGGDNEQKTIDIAGYQMQAALLEELAGQALAKLSDFNGDCYWFEWQAASEALSPAKIKQQQSFAQKDSQLYLYQVDDVKFWQATALHISSSYLTQEQAVFSQLRSAQGESN
ncbi:hydrolase 2, exosortase A system-associated [Colwellia piezophila]|uniref:hydrolase 2, exosortase A system-associated n=1 Tax=Colwellia piezophila TaxID=211668 RepID=UPI0003697FEC|nr:hydrolase 2, exosortase A system-associated [Colwellia piezophila]